MSPRESSARSLQKRNYDVYTVMLYISFIALVTACLLLYYELRAYGVFPWWRPAPSAAVPAAFFELDEIRAHV